MEQLVKLIEAASADSRPARLAYGEGKATFAINRRAGRTLKKGEPVDRSALVPVDHSVPVLQVTGAEGKVAAVLFGYACHNTTTPIYHYNGDYAGYAQIALEAAHPGATALFMIGCGGDSNPDPRGKIELAEKYGKSPAQVSLRWLIQQGAIVIPNAASEDHMRENMAVFDFEISPDDARMIDRIENKHRVVALDP